MKSMCAINHICVCVELMVDDDVILREFVVDLCRVTHHIYFMEVNSPHGWEVRWACPEHSLLHKEMQAGSRQAATQTHGQSSPKPTIP